MEREQKTEFSDLPPEIRWAAQEWLAPDIFWDRESRVWAEELFNKWAQDNTEVAKFVKLMDEFGQNFVQCYRFAAKRKFTFGHWFFKEEACEWGCRRFENPKFDKFCHVYNSNVVICTKPTTRYRRSPKYLEIDLIMGIVNASYSGVSGEFAVKPNEKLLIEVSFESGLWSVDFTIGNAEADSKYWIEARDLCEALGTWPFVKVGGVWWLTNPRG
jgi:hypothetical protein